MLYVVPAGSLCFVPSTGCGVISGSDKPFLIEALEADMGGLPGGLLIPGAVMFCISDHIAVPIVNVSTSPVYIEPHTCLATLQPVELIRGRAAEVVFNRISPEEEQVTVLEPQAVPSARVALAPKIAQLELPELTSVQASEDFKNMLMYLQHLIKI